MCYMAKIPMLYYSRIAFSRPQRSASVEIASMVGLQKTSVLRVLGSKNGGSVPWMLSSTLARFPGLTIDSTEAEVEDTFKNCSNELLWLGALFQNIKDRAKIASSSDMLYLYTNDYDIIEQLNGRNHYRAMLRVVEVPLPPGELFKKDSEYSFRSYLTSKNFTTSEKEALERYISNSGASVSPALARWFRSPGANTSARHFFIDHNSLDILTLISLIKPGLVNKSVKIVTSKAS